MKINEFVTTTDTDDPRSSILDASFEDALALIKLNCSDALIALSKKKAMWKGMRGVEGDFIKTDPKLMKRKSANTSNQYTLLMSNLPSWKRYPRRDESLICSTARTLAGGYGKLHLVLPFNGAKIGVCDSYDLWDSFVNLNNNYGINGPERFNLALSQADVYAHSYDDMLETILKPSTKKELEYSSYNLLKSMAKINTKRELIKLLDGVLSPKNNQFKLTTIKGIPPTPSNSSWRESHELWTDSESYLIREDSRLFSQLKWYLGVDL
jgi:hypothetical protein